MEQDFKYEEENFETGRKEIEKPFSVDEMIEDENKEVKLSFISFIKEKKKPFIIAGAISIVTIVSILGVSILLKQNSHNNDKESLNKEIENGIQFDQDGFLIEEEIQSENEVFHYSLEDTKRLREAGYTNVEIEEFESMEVTNLDSLINDAQEQKKKQFLEIYRIFLRDAQSTGNEEYLYALANTWLGLSPQIINPDGQVNDYYKSGCNADYWKLPLQGCQPMLKLKFIDQTDQERTIYLSVEPSVYISLRDSGNINITYDFINAYGCDFITNIQQTDY